MSQCTGQSTIRGAYEAAYGRKQHHVRNLIAVAGFGSFD